MMHLRERRLLCYHTGTVDELAEVINEYSKEGKYSSVMMEDLIGDIFGDFHQKFHAPPPDQPLIVMLNRKQDFWNGLNLYKSLEELLICYQIESLSFLKECLKFLTSHPVNLWNNTSAQNALCRQESLSLDMLLELTSWALLLVPYNLSKDIPKYTKEILDLVKVLFSHPLFPSEKLTLYCGHVSKDIRDIAINMPGCPTEGKVVASLMGAS